MPGAERRIWARPFCRRDALTEGASKHQDMETAEYRDIGGKGEDIRSSCRAVPRQDHGRQTAQGARREHDDASCTPRGRPWQGGREQWTAQRGRAEGRKPEEAVQRKASCALAGPHRDVAAKTPRPQARRSRNAEVWLMRRAACR